MKVLTIFLSYGFILYVGRKLSLKTLLLYVKIP